MQKLNLADYILAKIYLANFIWQNFVWRNFASFSTGLHIIQTARKAEWVLMCLYVLCARTLDTCTDKHVYIKDGLEEIGQEKQLDDQKII